MEVELVELLIGELVSLKDSRCFSICLGEMMPSHTVWDVGRKKRKAVVANTYEELTKGRMLFSVLSHYVRSMMVLALKIGQDSLFDKLHIPFDA